LALAFFYLNQRRAIGGGALVGVAFVLKLYAGPFFLFFAARRQWKTLMAGILGALGMVALAAVLFGLSDVTYFASNILPRALAGDLIDPYHPGYQTLSTLLRRTFVMEPELNPHPAWNAPWVFFLLGPLATLSLLALPLIYARADHFKRDFAWFFLAVVLASTSTASYTFVLLLLPVMLLLDDEGPLGRLMVLACYALAAMPLRPGWMPFFPKLWVLLAHAVEASQCCGSRCAGCERTYRPSFHWQLRTGAWTPLGANSDRAEGDFFLVASGAPFGNCLSSNWRGAL